MSDQAHTELGRGHLAADSVVSCQPDVCLLAGGCVEVPATVRCQQLRELRGVAVRLAVYVLHLVLALEVEHVDGEPDIFKERIALNHLGEEAVTVEQDVVGLWVVPVYALDVLLVGRLQSHGC